MQSIDIDFAHPHQTWSPTGPLIALALILLAGFLLWQHYTELTKDIEQQQSKINTQSTPEVIASSPALDDTIALAHQLESKLNIHWIGTLSALEAAQQAHPALKLIHIKPSANRQQLSLIGVAQQFETISGYMQSLEQNPMFDNVALKSQYNSIDHAGYIQFQLNMEWQP